MHNLTWQEKVEINLEALLNTNKALLERIERLEETQYEYLGVVHIAHVPDALLTTWPVSPSNLANDELPAAIASNLTEAMRCVSPPLDLTSDLGRVSKSRILEQLWCEIEAAQSRGIGWMSIRDMIRAHTEGHKNSE